MKPLEDMSLGVRLITTVAIVVVLFLLLAFIGWLSGGWQDAKAQPPEQQIYGDTQLDAILLRLDKRALDMAYEQRLIKLWEVWLGQQARDPTMFTTGLRTARRAYSEAVAAISRRERQLLEQELRHQERK